MKDASGQAIGSHNTHDQEDSHWCFLFEISNCPTTFFERNMDVFQEHASPAGNGHVDMQKQNADMCASYIKV